MINKLEYFYPEIGNEKLKPILTEKINLVANDFENLVKMEIKMKKIFKRLLKIGLNRFS